MVWSLSSTSITECVAYIIPLVALFSKKKQKRETQNTGTLYSNDYAEIANASGLEFSLFQQKKKSLFNPFFSCFRLSI